MIIPPSYRHSLNAIYKYDHNIISIPTSVLLVRSLIQHATSSATDNDDARYGH